DGVLLPPAHGVEEGRVKTDHAFDRDGPGGGGAVDGGTCSGSWSRCGVAVAGRARRARGGPATGSAVTRRAATSTAARGRAWGRTWTGRRAEVWVWRTDP